MKRYVLALLAICLSALPAGAPGAAQEVLRAAAVVNDEVISLLDLDMRTRLAILATGQDETPELRRRVMPQVMRTLIDERLQAQEAERLDITVAEQEVSEAIAQLAQRNQRTPETFIRLLEERGVLEETLRQQVRAQLTWHELITRRLRPSVQVSADDVEEVVERIAATEGTMQRRIAEIFLPVDTVLQEEEIRESAQRLMEQLRAGADFAALARQFSQSATAPRGGDIGWVQPGQLAPELDSALEQMKPGTVAGPIRSLSGFHIVLLRDQRQATGGETVLDLKQILVPLDAQASEAERQEAVARVSEIRGQITGCDDVEQVASALGAPGSGDLGSVKLNELPQPVRQVLAALPVDQPSEPVRVPAGFSVLVVCDRTEAGIDREGIRAQLVEERLDIQARRYMRDLRRTANVDIRI